LRRQKIYDAVCAGHIADALAIVKAQYGQAVLQQNPHLHFKLRVQQFVELVRGACISSPKQQQQQQQSSKASNGAGASSLGSGFEAALAYGRAELGPGSKSDQDEELLSDALSLLAYADPAASPCGHLLRESFRADLAEDLNGALLKVRCRDCWVAAVVTVGQQCFSWWPPTADDTCSQLAVRQDQAGGVVCVCVCVCVCACVRACVRACICSTAGGVPGLAG
jgi:hypothetical protein